VTDHYDVLVIGSGPGGASTAARVAETGHRVLLLERGDFLPRERDNWDSRAVLGAAKYTADETFYDGRDRPFRPELHYYPMGNIQMIGKSDEWQLKAAAPRGLQWAPSAPYAEVARHSVDFWLCAEDLPLADSRVTLRPDGAIRLALQPGNNAECLTRLRTSSDRLASAGLVSLFPR